MRRVLMLNEEGGDGLPSWEDAKDMDDGILIALIRKWAGYMEHNDERFLIEEDARIVYKGHYRSDYLRLEKLYAVIIEQHEDFDQLLIDTISARIQKKADHWFYERWKPELIRTDKLQHIVDSQSETIAKLQHEITAFESMDLLRKSEEE